MIKHEHTDSLEKLLSVANCQRRHKTVPDHAQRVLW